MPKNSRSGFTIIELMVSILVLALISVAATSALSVGKRIWEKVQASPSVPLLEAELNVLREVVSSRVSIGVTVGGGVSGAEKSLEFQGLVDAGGGGFVLEEVQITASKDGLAVQHSNGTQKKLLSRIIVEEISYYGRIGNDEFDAWHKAWLPSSPSPKLIRFKFAETDYEDAFHLDFALHN